MADVTINQNIAECLRSTSSVGGTTVHNICSGAENYVAWGSLDWVLFFGLGAFGVAIILLFLGMGLTILRGY